MIKKILKWTGFVLVSLLALLLIFYAVVYFKTESRANKVYEVAIQQLNIPTDSASFALGAHIAAVRGCNDCHANGGKAFFDEHNPIATLYAANLTSGKGGINYADKDWIRALRHAVSKEGKPLWFMPVQHTSGNLSNKDLGALISYLKQLPPIDKATPQKKINPLGRMLTFLGKFPMFPAEIIDHTASFPDEIKPTATAVYGKYLAVVCQGCHGSNFKGGDSHEPGGPHIPDLTTTGNMGKWNSAQFITTLHTGKTPEGKMLTEYMPWRTIGVAHNEEELQAIYLYLHQTN